MQLGLEGMGRENEDLIAAMAGLCDGMHRGDMGPFRRLFAFIPYRQGTGRVSLR